MTASKIMAKRAAAGTLALAVCLTGGLVSAGAANAAAGFAFDVRVQGADRYETSAAASAAAFPSGASSIVITNGLSEVDGLTASYVAGLHSAPILYTSGPDTISAPVQTEITRLKATTVYIVGGETVVSKATEDKLKATYGAVNVIRYGGADRYETAAKAATSGTTKPAKVIVASGVSFADALVAGPIAYKQKYPILLTAATGVPSYTEAALKTLAVDTVNVVGGTTVVTDATYAAVGGDKRLGGETRQETATKVAVDAIANEGFSNASLALVGNINSNAADALVAAPLAAKNNAPLLFIDNPTSTITSTYLKANAATLTGEGYVFGGTTAVPVASVTAATAAAAGTAPAGLTVTTAVTGVRTVSTTTGDNVNRGAVTYTVAVPSDVKEVNIALYNAADVVTTSAGVTTFKSSAAVSSGAAVIESVNGAVSGANTYTTKAAPIGGTVSFVVDATATANVVPVVFVDKTGGVAGQLGFDTAPSATTAQAPNEVFAVGTAARFVPEVSQGGTITSALVTYVDKATKTFSTANATYTYDANDSFVVDADGVSRGLEYFEARLPVGDTVGGNFAPGSAPVSSITLTKTGPAVPGPVTEVANSATVSTVQVTVPNISTAAADAPTVRVYGGKASDSPVRTTAPLLATATTDANTTVAGFQVNLASLATNTGYTVWATQEIGGEESARSATGGTTGTTAATALVANGSSFVDVGGTNGAADTKLNAGDRLDFSFTGPVTVGSTFSLVLRDSAGRERTVSNTNSSAAVTGTNGNILRITVGANGPDVGTGTGELNVASFQVLSASGISNATGTWNLPGSGGARQLAGSQPVALAANVITLDGTADTIAVTGLGNNTEYIVRTYSTSGVLLGAATATTNGSGAFPATAVGGDVVAGTSYLVTYQSTASGAITVSAATTKVAS